MEMMPGGSPKKHYLVEPLKTKFLSHRFDSRATDFGYTRAFEHEAVAARRNTLIDPQGVALHARVGFSYVMLRV